MPPKQQQIGGRSVQRRGVFNFLRASYERTCFKTDNASSPAAKARLLRHFEEGETGRSLDCQDLVSLPPLPARQEWHLRNCSTLRIRSPNFLASPDTEIVSLQNCPRQFESLEFMRQLPKLNKLYVVMASSPEPEPTLGEDLNGQPCAAPVDLALCPGLEHASFRDFGCVPKFTGLRGHRALRELMILGCTEPIEARHLTGISACEKLQSLDLSYSKVDSLPEELFAQDKDSARSYCVYLNPSKISPELLQKITAWDKSKASMHFFPGACFVMSDAT
jgi:hypothetical protein